jgi:hypothetical protein
MTVGSGIGLDLNEKNPQVVNTAIQQLQQGRSNALVLATLTANTTTTTVTAPNCGPGSAPIPVPMTANAAAALATMYISTVSNGSFVVTHANNAQTDRTFRFFTPG